MRRLKTRLAIVIYIFLSLASDFTSGQLLQGVFAYGGTAVDLGRSIVQTSDGGYAVTGYTQSYSSGSASVYVIKLDTACVIQWTKSIGGASDDEGYSIIQTSDGGYAITGSSTSFGSGSEDVYVIKLNASGDTTWTRTIGGPADEWAYSIVQVSDGGYAVAGYTRSYGSGNGDVYVVKLDAAGTVKWTKTIGGTAYDYGRSIVQSRDGGLVITGGTYSSGAGVNDVYIVKLDSTGNLKWTKTIGGTGNDYGISIVATKDGGYAIAGLTNSYGAAQADVYILKVDSAGSLQWSKTIGGSAADEGYSIIQTKDGGYAVTGLTWSYSVSGLNDDVFALRLDSAGNTLAAKIIGGGTTTNSEGYSIIQTKDGGFAIAGLSYYYGAGTQNVLVIKLDSAFNSCADQSKAVDTSSGAIVSTSAGSVNIGGKVSHGGISISGGMTTIVCTEVVKPPPPVAGFQASKATICANDCIDFTNLSTNATFYQWYFAGAEDSISTDQNPQFICYSKPGIYNVTLIDSGPGGRDTLTISSYISVIAAPPPPVISQVHNDTLVFHTQPGYQSYQWYFDSVIVQNATDTFLVITKSGNYNVQVTNTYGCVSAAGTNININGVLQIPDKSGLNDAVSVSPNPVKDKFTVYGLQFTAESIEIYDVLGKKVQSDQPGTRNTKQEAINISTLSSGIYFLRIIGDNKRWEGKFVKE